jgi:hypothetical protein
LLRKRVEERDLQNRAVSQIKTPTLLDIKHDEGEYYDNIMFGRIGSDVSSLEHSE